MKNFIRRLLRGWLNSSKDLAVASPAVQGSLSPNVRLGIIKAINGTAIEVGTQKTNQYGPDWVHELYLVREDQSLEDAIKTIIAIKALEK